MSRKIKVLLLVASFLFLFGCGISGTVTDEGGKSVEGVTVTLSNVLTSMETITDSEGNYHFSSMLSGECNIKAALYGYRFDPKNVYVTMSGTYKDVEGVDFIMSDALYQEEFNAILDTLTTNYWDPSGNWVWDAQGDATAFAPMVLYPVGKEKKCLEMIEMANQTVEYEVGLIESFLKDFQISENLVVGFPALASGYQYTKNPKYHQLLSSATLVGSTMIEEKPELFLDYIFDYATVFGTGSYMCFTAYESLSTDLIELSIFEQKGLKLIELAEEYWNEEEGLYDYSRAFDWPQATMLMALAKAFKSTGRNEYLERCNIILDSLNTLAWDTYNYGYYGHYDIKTKALSGNNNMVLALLELYESTGDNAYIERAKAVIEWILSEDLYDPVNKIVFHHWTESEGRSGSFCTGCNFHTLYNIYRFNKLF